MHGDDETFVAKDSSRRAEVEVAVLVGGRCRRVQGRRHQSVTDRTSRSAVLIESRVDVAVDLGWLAVRTIERSILHDQRDHDDAEDGQQAGTPVDTPLHDEPTRSVTPLGVTVRDFSLAFPNLDPAFGERMLAGRLSAVAIAASGGQRWKSCWNCMD